MGSVLPILYLRRLTSSQRTAVANEHLAAFLVFVAGAVNAGGFLAVRRYTSHMSGVVASMSDALALTDTHAVLSGAIALCAFISGAASAAILINWGRRLQLGGAYALPLVVEAALLVIFGIVGGRQSDTHGETLTMTILVLCYIMGLQNAMITKVSNAEIRTTHVTGMITDIGIEVGKLLYFNIRQPLGPGGRIRGNRGKLKLLSLLVALFFVGGVSGALAFKYFGFVSALPLAGLVMVLGVVPISDDFKRGFSKS